MSDRVTRKRAAQLSAVVTRSLEAIVAFITIAVLHPYGFVGTGPLWYTLLGVVYLGLLQQPAVIRGIRIGPLRRWRSAALGLHFIAVAWIIYSLGWGPVLPLAFAMFLTHHIRIEGSSLWRPALVWMVACIAVGQTGIALGWIFCYLPDTEAQIAGLLGLLLTGLFIRAYGQATAERERAEAAVRDREERFRILVQDSLDVLSVIDEHGHPSYLSPGISKVTGFPVEHYDRGGYAGHIHPDDLPVMLGALDLINADPASHQTIQVRIRHANGQWRWMEATLRDFRDKPAVGGIVTTFRDVTERREIQERLNYEARHDRLTGLLNRAAFLDTVEQMPAAPAVLFIDLDGFKPINDTHGHRYGDAILVAVASLLHSQISDLTDLAGRLGGDEFAIALTSPATAARAVEVADRLLEAMTLPISVDGRVLEIGASIGIAVPAAGETIADLLHQADLAMYAAKRRGTHDAQLYDPDVVEESLQVART